MTEYKFRDISNAGVYRAADGTVRGYWDGLEIPLQEFLTRISDIRAENKNLRAGNAVQADSLRTALLQIDAEKRLYVQNDTYLREQLRDALEIIDTRNKRIEDLLRLLADKSSVIDSANRLIDELHKWARSQAESHHDIAVKYAHTDEDRLTTHNAMSHAYTVMVAEIEKRKYTEKRKCDG